MSRSGGGRAAEGLPKTSRKKKSQADIRSIGIASAIEKLGGQDESDRIEIIEDLRVFRKG